MYYEIIHTLLFFILSVAFNVKAQEVLIVADEILSMQVLVKSLKVQEGVTSKIIFQTELPVSLTNFRAVIVYNHKDIDPGPEKAFIEYTQNGGKLIVLHHSISSAKRKNAEWFSFLGLDLPKKDVSEGGYKYVGDITMELVNFWLPLILSLPLKSTMIPSLLILVRGKAKKKNCPVLCCQRPKHF